jgi:RimJ/RimL family protein N-acetyltransferase
MTSRSPVRIETDRLILDGHTRNDFEPLAQLWADAAVCAQMGAKLSSRQESWMRLLRYQGLWPVLGFGYWAVRDKASGRYMGDVGFADFYRDMTPSIAGLPEAGWVLAPWAQGQGFAKEAMGAALAWLDAGIMNPNPVCLIAPHNTRSLELAGKLGFGAPKQALLSGRPMLLLAR